MPPGLSGKAGPWENLANDFEEGLFSKHPELPAIKARLLELGAEGALLSGSGSALFGYFTRRAARDEAVHALASEETGQVFCCETMAAHTYLPGTEIP